MGLFAIPTLSMGRDVHVDATNDKPANRYEPGRKGVCFVDYLLTCKRLESSAEMCEGCEILQS